MFVNSAEHLDRVNAQLAVSAQAAQMRSADLKRPEYLSYVLNVLNTQLLWPSSKARKQLPLAILRYFAASTWYVLFILSL